MPPASNLATECIMCLAADATQSSPARSARKRPSRKSASNTPMARWNLSARMTTGAWRLAQSRSPRFTAARILTRGLCSTAGTNPTLTIPNGRRRKSSAGRAGNCAGFPAPRRRSANLKFTSRLPRARSRMATSFSTSARMPRTFRKFPSPGRRAAGFN